MKLWFVGIYALIVIYLSGCASEPVLSNAIKANKEHRKKVKAQKEKEPETPKDTIAPETPVEKESWRKRMSNSWSKRWAKLRGKDKKKDKKASDASKGETETDHQ